MTGIMTPTTSAPLPLADDYAVIRIPLSKLKVDHEWNCRGKVTPWDVQDLIPSIKERGLDSPIIVREIDDPIFTHELIAGFRRTTSFKAINKELPNDIRFQSIPAKVVAMTDAEAATLNLVENIQRQDLTLYQEARGLQRMSNLGFTPEYIAARIGKPVRWVNSRLIILKLPEDMQEVIDKGILNIKQVERLDKLPNNDKRYEFIRQIRDSLITLDKLESPDRKKPSATAVVPRSRADMNRLLMWVYDNIGPSLATRVMAWSVGNIPTSDLFPDLQAAVKEAHGEHALIGLEMPDV